jgi:carbon monoxide dehydrogenase subunit G
MNLAGAFTVPADRQAVWAMIRDPAVMASCIPGCDQIESLSPSSYRARVIASVGPIQAVFALVVEVIREEPPVSVHSVTRGEEGTRASVLNAKNVVTLSEVEGGLTEVAYASEVSITGRLGKFGLGVMKKKAEALSLQFAEAFRAKLAER